MFGSPPDDGMNEFPFFFEIVFNNLL
jgi:hypothetical protein